MSCDKEDRLPTDAVTTTLVTVTYGERLSLLIQCLQSAFAEGVTSAIVIDNASRTDVAEAIAERFGSRVSVHRLLKNSGSAPAFAQGLRLASSSGSDYILILDDDNRLLPCSLSELIAAHLRWSARVGPENVAVQASRVRQHDLLIQYPSLGMFGGSRSAFHGFHAADLPLKLLRRSPLGRVWLDRRRPRAEVLLHVTSYSGLFLKPGLLARHAYPDERYVLYADDVDFTAKFVRAGGRLVLLRDATIEDIEESWNRQALETAIDGFLSGSDDFRAFYAVRNTEYFEAHVRGEGWLRPLNRAIFMSILYLRALQLGRRARMTVIRDAIKQGRLGALGENPAFPLH